MRCKLSGYSPPPFQPFKMKPLATTYYRIEDPVRLSYPFSAPSFNAVIAGILVQYHAPEIKNFPTIIPPAAQEIIVQFPRSALFGYAYLYFDVLKILDLSHSGSCWRGPKPPDGTFSDPGFVSQCECSHCCDLLHWHFVISSLRETINGPRCETADAQA